MWLRIPEMFSHAPAIDERVIRSHFAEQGGLEKYNIRALKEGFSIIQSLADLELLFHPGDEVVQFLRMECPATLRDQKYSVGCKLLVVSREGEAVGYIMKVLSWKGGIDGGEGCKGQNQVGCVHLSALLQALQNLLIDQI
jgi:hypothetical protein